MKRCLISICFLCLSGLGGLLTGEEGASGSIDRVAKSYLDAYTSSDEEALRHLLADDAEMLDVTAPAHFASAMRKKGREAIISYLNDYLKPVFEFPIRYDTHRSFFSESHAVFEANLIFYAKGPALGMEVKRPFFRIPIVTVLKIENGKVTEHIDFTDYQSYARQIQAYRDMKANEGETGISLPEPPPLGN